MADGTFNIALGREVGFALNVNNNTPSTAVWVVALIQSAGLEADDVLNNHDTFASLFTTNTEATATGYGRKTLDDATGGIVITVDDTGNTSKIDIPNQLWTSLGGATNNTFGKVVIGYNETGGGDAGIVPVFHFDLSAPNDTTNGQNFTVQINASGLLTIQG